jgi:hypothetical protein
MNQIEAAHFFYEEEQQQRNHGQLIPLQQWKHRISTSTNKRTLN